MQLEDLVVGDLLKNKDDCQDINSNPLQADDATVRVERNRDCSDPADDSAGRQLLKKSAELIVIKRRWRPIEKPVVLAAVGGPAKLTSSARR